MIDIIVGHYNYWVVIFLMMAGFYTVIDRGNLIKKIAGLSIFQTSVFLLYISIGYVSDGTTPIIAEGFKIFQPLAPCADTDRDCRRRFNDRAWPCAYRSHQ